MQDFVVPADRPWQKTYQEHGLTASIELPQGVNSLLDSFEQNFAKHKNHTAFTGMNTSITYGELDTYSLKIASYLQSIGLQKGDKVAVMMPNVLQYPIVMLGVLRAGMVLVNVNPLYTANELGHQLKDSHAKALFVIENFAHTVEKVSDKGQLKHIIVASIGDMMGLKGVAVNFVVRYIKKMVPTWNIPNHTTFKDALKQASAGNYVRPDLTLDDVALLQYTGGTTGVAKGAMLTHRNLIANVEQADAVIRVVFPRDEDLHEKYVAIALPLYHIFSFTVCSLLSMKMGFAGLLIVNARDFTALTKDFAKYKPVFFPAVNTLFNALANHDGFKSLDHSQLRLSLGGGMSVLATTAEQWHKITGSHILEGYGLSETSPILSVVSPHDTYTGTIGVPLASTDLVLLDEQDNEVALGEMGEICAKGPQVMLGYYNRPDETEKAMTKDGYFRTGDIGIMDEKGYIKIVDRKKDMVLVSGFNVYPNEVEEVISAHPKVLECGVIGVPDAHSGEVVKVFVVRKDQSLSEQEVKAWAKENLTGYKRPKYIEFLTELPKSNVGKILRKELRALEAKKG